MFERVLRIFTPPPPSPPVNDQPMSLSLAKEKRRLEGLARDYGISKNQAKRLVHDYFKQDAEVDHE